MNNETSELLYVAYKNLVLNNIKSGFLGQHISDADYHALDKFPKLFFEVLDEYYNRYATGGFLNNFYTVNPYRSKDIEFSKEVFVRLRNELDFKVLLERIGEDAFINDIPLLKKAFEKVDGGALITSYGFKKLKTHQKLMEALYDSDKFSLMYFDLPAPTDDALIKNILRKDPRSYSKLSLEQKSNKEYAIISLESAVNKQLPDIEKIIYQYISFDLRKDEDVALMAAKGSCLGQPEEAFVHPKVLTNFLESISPKSNGRFQAEIRLYKIEEIPIHAFNVSRNIKELFDWLNKNKNLIINSHENYVSCYKTIKSISKINNYVKEQFSKKNSDWNKGNIGETKHESSKFFMNYFSESVDKIANELTHYVMADELNKSLENKTLVTRKMKI